MKRTNQIKQLLSIAALSLGLTACGGDSGPKNLFEMDFESNPSLRAQVDVNEITGYWESTDRSDYHSRLKIEDNQLTFAGKCISAAAKKEVVTQASGEISINDELQSIAISETMEKTATKSGYRCWFRLPAGTRTYEVTERGLEIDGMVSAFGVFVKIGELEEQK